MWSRLKRWLRWRPFEVRVVDYHSRYLFRYRVESRSGWLPWHKARARSVRNQSDLYSTAVEYAKIIYREHQAHKAVLWRSVDQVSEGL